MCGVCSLGMLIPWVLDKILGVELSIVEDMNLVGLPLFFEVPLVGAFVVLGNPLVVANQFLEGPALPSPARMLLAAVPASLEPRIWARQCMSRRRRRWSRR